MSGDRTIGHPPSGAIKKAGVLNLPLELLTLAYLALPLLIFLAFWLKPIWAVLAIGPVLFCGRCLVRAWPVEPATLRRGEIIFVVAFGLAVTAFVGIGGFAPQQYDWNKHNAMLYDCVNLPWPVILPAGAQRWPLVYYIAWYLPPAAVGKMAGYAMANIALWLWSSAGAILSCLWFARLARLSVVVGSLAFFCFSGLDSVGDLLVQSLGMPNHSWGADFYPNQAWAGIWMFPSHFWMLDWAPGQALGGWLAAGLFLSSPKTLRPASFAFLLTCSLLWSPLVSVGLCLLAFFLIVQQGLVWPVKPTAPILALILPVGMLVCYYLSKMSPEIDYVFPTIPVDWFTDSRFSKGLLPSVVRLLLFGLLEFGVLLWFVRLGFAKDSDERKLAGACGLSLLCLLPLTVGFYSDLSMRGSTVPLFCLAVLTAQALRVGNFTRRTRGWFWCVILLGCMTPFLQVVHVGGHIFDHRYYHHWTPDRVPALVNLPEGFLYWGQQYVGSTNSVFFQYLAR